MTSAIQKNGSQAAVIEKNNLWASRCENILKVTALFASLIALTIAVIASMVTTHMLNETFSFYNLRHIGQLGSGIFLTLSFIATLVAATILIKSCVNPLIAQKKNI